ncbi:hypothetical protein LAJ55_15310, partial [Streptococcus pneumoniae]|nr:hypothetical protein [Streptococcus pneumoniae]
KVAAKFRNNKMSPGVLPHYVHKICKYYNDAHCLLEINDMGSSVATVLHEELEYENLIICSNRGRRGQKADGGFSSGRPQYG